MLRSGCANHYTTTPAELAFLEQEINQPVCIKVKIFHRLAVGDKLGTGAAFR